MRQQLCRRNPIFERRGVGGVNRRGGGGSKRISTLFSDGGNPYLEGPNFEARHLSPDKMQVSQDRKS